MVNFTHPILIDKILDVKNWQRLHDSLALVTKTAIIAVDYKGAAHEAQQPEAVLQLCAQPARSGDELPQVRFQEGLEAARVNAPCIYLCHCNIVNIAVHIILDGKYVGATMAGQIRLPESEQGTPLEKILVSSEPRESLPEEIAELYEQIPILPFREVKQVAQMLHDLCGYIVGEAMNKNLILEMYEKSLAASDAPEPPLPIAGYSAGNRVQVKKTVDNVITNAYVKSSALNPPICKNPAIQPAFDYIFENKSEAVSQKQMARLCHISTSHFSRLFAKETGERFSNFVARMKVEWSKQLLEQTDLPINQISDELGFNDAGYFIKTFRKFENQTPASYRKYYLEKR